MTIKKIICDRCGSDINEEHPIRYNREEYKEHANPFGAKVMSYKRTKIINLCKHCQKDFTEFMKAQR